MCPLWQLAQALPLTGRVSDQCVSHAQALLHNITGTLSKVGNTGALGVPVQSLMLSLAGCKEGAVQWTGLHQAEPGAPQGDADGLGVLTKGTGSVVVTRVTMTGVSVCCTVNCVCSSGTDVLRNHQVRIQQGTNFDSLSACESRMWLWKWAHVETAFPAGDVSGGPGPLLPGSRSLC